jgi:hypothetical protein
MSDTLAALRAAYSRGSATVDDLQKISATFVQSTTSTTGLTEYDLEPVAKELYPVLTPLLKSIPRVAGKGGIQANWKTIKGITGSSAGSYVNAGVAEGMRGANVSTGDYYAAYRGIGLESSLSFEAESAAEGFDDLRARAVHALLQSKMLIEEAILLGSNSIYAIGQGPTPIVVAAQTGGTIAASTAVYVGCVPLTYDGYMLSTNAGPQPGPLNRANADGTTTIVASGTGRASAVANLSTAAGSATNSVTASVAPMQGAWAYAWFVGVAGTQYFYATTTTASVLITSVPVSGTLMSVFNADYSQCNLYHDGLLGFIGNPNNGSYYAAVPNGAGLTADGTGGIVEFDTALKYFWDVLRLSPDEILVSSQEMLFVRKKVVLAGSQSSNARFTFNNAQGAMVGGGMIKGYLNTYSMTGQASEIPVTLHPNMPAGTVMFITHKLPYPLANISNVMNVRCRRDNYQIEWPRTNRTYQYGVYSDQVLQHYFMQSLGVITNLSPV